MSFDNVWNSIHHWRRYWVEDKWSEENLEFLDKALSHADSMRLIRLANEGGWEITPVPESFDDGDAEDRDNHEVEDKGSNIIDIGGSLTKLKAEMEAGVHYTNNHIEFQGPHDLQTDIGHGLKIRLCNSIFATEVASRGK
jgi:hypothetical protein